MPGDADNKRRIDEYLARARVEGAMSAEEQANIGIPSTGKRLASSATSKQRQALPEKAHGQSAEGFTPTQASFGLKIPPDLFASIGRAVRPDVKQKTVKIPIAAVPFEGMKTSILPKVGPEGAPPPPPPPPDRRPYESQKEYERRKYKENNPPPPPPPTKPPNFQKLQDNIKQRRLEQLGQVARLGHNVSKLGQAANRVGSSWPLLPGGIVFPLTLLFILVLLIIPVNGQTRIGWLWAAMFGGAVVNPGYIPANPNMPGQGEFTPPPGQGGGPTTPSTSFTQDYSTGLGYYTPMSYTELDEY